MKKINPTLPKGMRDISPTMLRARRHILAILNRHFELYGFEPLETPAMEQLTTLTGKYGQEGDRLLFKVLNSGDFLSKAPTTLLNMPSAQAAFALADKGLRYDLTIPLARYVAQNRAQITFPFKRSQIQPVWRADRPQRGRYREFYQCDIDIIGKTSTLAEAEICTLVHHIMHELQLPDYRILLNHRAIFSGLAHMINASGKEQLLCRLLDKADKLSHQDLLQLLQQEGFTQENLKNLDWIFHMPDSLEDQLTLLKDRMNTIETAQPALQEIEETIHYIKSFDLPDLHISLQPTLARGMDYYTGTIFELIVPNSGLGSLGGGGRYSNLTSLFGLTDTPGIGFSFGLERIYDLMQARNLFPSTLQTTTQLLIVPLDVDYQTTAITYLKAMRKERIPTELFTTATTLTKALRYAQKRHIPWIALLGSQEVKEHKITLKNMQTGEQKLLSLDRLLCTLQKIV